MGRKYTALATVSALVTLSLLAAPCGAQFGKIAKKAKDKIEKKAEEKTDKAIDKATGEGETPEAPPAGAAGDAAGEQSAAAPAAGGGGWELYKKYDFIPGNKVIYYDDLSRDELGEFPTRWSLDKGVFEVAQMGPEKWITCTDEGFVTPKIVAGPLPERYTVELDFYDHGSESPGHWMNIVWLDAEGKDIGYFRFADHAATTLHVLDKDVATKRLSAAIAKGPHTMRIMATKTTIKCYVDNERVANVPQVEGFNPAGFKLWADLWANDLDKYPLMFRNFRFAEGGKTMKEQLDESGRIVTHGILFSSGSAEIRPESYKTLADIGGLLTAEPALRVSIEGHTDADGADDANKKLSEARAASVRTYLTANFQVAAERLESKGFGETKPIDSNESPEGKANNRRVELVKL